MCGRGTLTVNETQLEERFGSRFYSEDLERYNPLPTFNMAPTHWHPILSMNDASFFTFMRWGLVPFWAKDVSIGSKMINARVETILEKPAFKRAAQAQRCLVPLDGYYEWEKSGNQRIPYRITRNDKAVFAAAGIYDIWKGVKEELLISFSIITCPAHPSIAHIHDRMPLILQPDIEHHWLDEREATEELLKESLLVQEDILHYYRVSSLVNKVAMNHEGLIAPLDKDGNNTFYGQQLTLF